MRFVFVLLLERPVSFVIPEHSVHPLQAGSSLIQLSCRSGEASFIQWFFVGTTIGGISSGLTISINADSKNTRG